MTIELKIHFYYENWCKFQQREIWVLLCSIHTCLFVISSNSAICFFPSTPLHLFLFFFLSSYFIFLINLHVLHWALRHPAGYSCFHTRHVLMVIPLAPKTRQRSRVLLFFTCHPVYTKTNASCGLLHLLPFWTLLSSPAKTKTMRKDRVMDSGSSTFSELIQRKSTLQEQMEKTERTLTNTIFSTRFIIEVHLSYKGKLDF